MLPTMSPPLDALLPQVTSALREAGGDALTSVLLYGSAVGGGYKPGKSNVNVLAVLCDDDADALRRLAAPTARVKDDLVVVHATTVAELAASARVFPLHVLELRDHHRVLFGDDPTVGVAVPDVDLRLAAEQALRTVARGMREALLLHGDDRRAIADAVRPRFRQMVYGLRGALRCYDDLPPTTDKHPTLERAARRFDLDLDMLLALLSFRRRLAPAPPTEIDRLAQGLLTSSVKAADHVRRGAA
jgi:predicted nucleotidyltransferase